MNKQEASEFLGVGVRSLERYTRQNRVAARYEKGKTGQTLVYDRDELERFKAELESATHLPVVEPLNRMETSAPPSSAKALATLGEPNEIGGIAREFALVMLATFSQLQPTVPAPVATAPEPSGPATLPVSQKLLLSLDEAQIYSGLSRANLLQAIHDEKLRAQKIGRGWKIKRRDLENYVEEL